LTTRLRDLDVAYSPLPWYSTVDGAHAPNAAPPLEDILARIRAAGFGAVPFEPARDADVASYLRMLSSSDLRPAPGYFAAPMAEEARRDETVAAAVRTAQRHAEAGLTEVSIADWFGDDRRRRDRPAVGEAYSEARIATIARTVAAVGATFRRYGIRACLHPHVGTWIETEAEVRTVLDMTDPHDVGFGPDTGHLAWAGADPAALIDDYRARTHVVHLKDVSVAIASRVREEQLDYASSVRAHIWAEPGRGDVDLAAVLQVLAPFDGWLIVEVDVPSQPTHDAAAQVSADWASRELARVARPTILVEA
jgi:inosose dehydratase